MLNCEDQHVNRLYKLAILSVIDVSSFSSYTTSSCCNFYHLKKFLTRSNAYTGAHHRQSAESKVKKLKRQDTPLKLDVPFQKG